MLCRACYKYVTALKLYFSLPHRTYIPGQYQKRVHSDPKYWICHYFELAVAVRSILLEPLITTRVSGACGRFPQLRKGNAVYMLRCTFKIRKRYFKSCSISQKLGILSTKSCLCTVSRYVTIFLLYIQSLNKLEVCL